MAKRYSADALMGLKFPLVDIGGLQDVLRRFYEFA